MTAVEWATEALNLFDAVVQGQAGLRERPGQRLMAERVACTFSEADLGKLEASDAAGAAEAQRSIAVVQAGTGVGKSLAYCVPAIAVALMRNTRVMISTATVALQEQLVHKDLPTLAASLPQPFRFALAKGRGRYVCRLKLDRLAGGEAHVSDARLDEGGDDDLFADEERQDRLGTPDHEHEARVHFYATLAQALERGRWDGDRDTLETQPSPDWWLPVAAEASSCAAKHCPAYGQCSYYEQRKALVGAQVIVVNHDLLLASLGSRQLPELDNCLLVLDEAHHLPGTALEQFASHMDLSRLTWVDRLASRALKVGAALAVEEIADIPKHAALVKQQLQDMGRLVMHHHGDALRAASRGWGANRGGADTVGRYRVPQGALHESMVAPLAALSHSAQVFLDALRAISKALRAEMRDHPEQARRLATMYAQLGALAPRLEAAHATTQWLLQDGGEGNTPVAKWFTLETSGDYIVVTAHASPTLPGATLRHHLWSTVRAAVLTSATLTSCGRFDFFLRESGLQDDPDVVSLEVPSPFDFARQGRLVTVGSLPDPKEVHAFNREMVQALMRDLATVQRGALVLFTSRDQLRQALEALPPELRERVAAQTEWPRAQLLARHRQRVGEGLPSIIFGMQSFGEGLDLPGPLCEDLFITKLPFMPPDDPVGEARAEWLRGAGRDPFMELVVPATAIRLAQWVGRAIRTEEDEAHVYCYDRRLTQTSYGQRLLQGLPNFTRVNR